MITVHHLNNSRSQRILWLLEELGTPYEIKFYQRDAVTNLAPPELTAVHPLGKSPVITDVDRTLIESGAIIDYIVRKYGNGRLAPSSDTAAYDQYQVWLHYAEGSAMLPLMMQLYAMRLGEGAAPIMPRISGEIENHIGFIAGALGDQDYLMGEFSAADIQMSFVGEVARAFGRTANHPNLAAWVQRLHDRPAFVKGLEKGGSYTLA
jgi:glutathione S-transferase